MEKIIIEFEDRGQDFLRWTVDAITGQVLECEPFQGSVWCKCIVTNVDGIKQGATHVYFRKTRGKKQSYIKYPIEKFKIAA